MRVSALCVVGDHEGDAPKGTIAQARVVAECYHSASMVAERYHARAYVVQRSMIAAHSRSNHPCAHLHMHTWACARVCTQHRACVWARSCAHHTRGRVRHTHTWSCACASHRPRVFNPGSTVCSTTPSQTSASSGATGVRAAATGGLLDAWVCEPDGPL